MNSQPLDYAPIILKSDLITPNPTQTNTKLPANETMPKIAMVTTSDMMIDTYTAMGNRTKERVSGEGRKEEEMVHTVFDNTKEEVR